MHVLGKIEWRRNRHIPQKTPLFITKCINLEHLYHMIWKFWKIRIFSHKFLIEIFFISTIILRNRLYKFDLVHFISLPLWSFLFLFSWIFRNRVLENIFKGELSFCVKRDTQFSPTSQIHRGERSNIRPPVKSQFARAPFASSTMVDHRPRQR